MKKLVSHQRPKTRQNASRSSQGLVVWSAESPSPRKSWSFPIQSWFNACRYDSFTDIQSFQLEMMEFFYKSLHPLFWRHKQFGSTKDFTIHLLKLYLSFQETAVSESSIKENANEVPSWFKLHLYSLLSGKGYTSGRNRKTPAPEVPQSRHYVLPPWCFQTEQAVLSCAISLGDNLFATIAETNWSGLKHQFNQLTLDFAMVSFSGRYHLNDRQIIALFLAEPFH